MIRSNGVNISLPAFAVWLKTVQEYADSVKTAIKNRLLEKSMAVKDSDWWHHLCHVIDEIFKAGYASRRYTPGTCQDSFDMTLGEISTELAKLKEKWKDEVWVDITESTCPEVSFSITSLDPRDGLLAAQFVSYWHTRSGQCELGGHFVQGLAKAIQNEKDMVSALAFLADEGYRLGQRSSPAWLNRIGS